MTSNYFFIFFLNMKSKFPKYVFQYIYINQEVEKIKHEMTIILNKQRYSSLFCSI